MVGKGKSNTSNQNWTKSQHPKVAKRALTSAVFNRRLFIPSGGAIGLCPKAAQDGVLLPSSTNTKSNDISTNTFAKGVEGSR